MNQLSVHKENEQELKNMAIYSAKDVLFFSKIISTLSNLTFDLIDIASFPILALCHSPILFTFMNV